MKRLVASSDVLYFSADQVDNIGELVADNLTHMYRKDGADFYYKYGKQGFDWKSSKYFVEITCEVYSHYDADINSESRYGAYLDGMNGKYYTAKKDFSYNRYDTQDTMARQLVINLTDDIENQIFTAVNPEMVESCSKVTAYSQMSSRRSRSVTKEVLDYLADHYPNSGLYKELVDKDIWINLWSDGEYNLSYNSVKDPETFLTDASTDELVMIMNELYPDSFWGDIVDVETCSKVNASDDIDGDCKYQAYSYYGTNYSGLEDDFCTNDPSTLIDWVWEHAANGGYIEVCGPKGCARLDPDDLAERVEFGDIGEHEIISQIDYV